MSLRIGVLLPRSTDYPSIGFDILDGLRCYFKQAGNDDVRFFSENIGFGENSALNYSKAEQMILENDVHLIIAYSNPRNAEPLYTLAETTQKPFLFLDAGVQHPETLKHPYAFHISLQGMQASYASGSRAAEGGRKILMATSFYEGGYRAPWAAVKGIENKGGSVCGNYVTAFRISEFQNDAYMKLLETAGPQAVVASFSTYLAELFMDALKQAGPAATPLPFYCSSFMVEEQLMQKMDFPGGTFHAVVPWTSSIDNETQRTFTATIKKEKNKAATIFHLLGWEAGIAAAHMLEHSGDPAAALAGWSFESPRGTQTFHPETHHTYGPLYEVSVVAAENGKCRVIRGNEIPADGNLQLSLLRDLPESSSDWKNNYLCI